MKKTILTLSLALASVLASGQPVACHSGQHFLSTGRGDPFFWLADTGWELFHRLDRKEASDYFITRKAQGFNIIQAVVLHELEAFETPNAYGDFPLIEQSIALINQTPGNDPEDPLEYDYWDHVKYILEQARKQDLIIGLLPCWGEYVTPRFRARTIENKLDGYMYGFFIGDWLKEYNDNIIWILGGDRLPDEQPDGVDIWRSMAEGITDGINGDKSFDGEADYETTFMTFHCFASSSIWFAEDPWIDMHTWGSYHGERNFERAFYEAWNQWNREPGKPFVNSEPAYENLPVNYDWKHAALGRFDAFDVRQIAYWSVFAGATGHTYGANEVWQMYKHTIRNEEIFKLNEIEWQDALGYEGANQMIHLKNLMLSYDFFSRHPHQDIVARNPHDPPGRLVACSGKDYSMVYAPTGKEIWLYPDKLAFKRYKARWYDPRTGEFQPGEGSEMDGLVVFDPPGEEERGNDWVLVIEEV